MTLRPLETALASMAAPLPESRGSTMSTLAPAVMSASAWVCMVDALPWALSILNWVKPAVWKALVRYGASKETYRADVVVSGSRTPTSPLPWVASDRSWFIAEKSLVNAVTLIETFLPLVVEVPLADFLDEPPQATSPAPTTKTTVRIPIRFQDTLIVSSGARGTRSKTLTVTDPFLPVEQALAQG